MIQISKRDGRQTTFDIDKIKSAIIKAFVAVDGCESEYAQTKAQNISQYILQQLSNDDSKIYNVEDIQDMVENGLMSCKRKDVAKAYITYRNNRTQERQKKTRLYKDIHEKMSARNIKNQNANVDENTFSGRMGETNSTIMRELALTEYLSPMARENHLNNLIYEHDLDSYVVGMHNCLTCPIDDLLANGFKVRQSDVRGANSINTAMQLVAVIFQLQSLQQFGGVSASHLDWTMVPYVRKSFAKHYKDGLRYIKQKTEGAIANKFCNVDVSKISIDDTQFYSFKEVKRYAEDLTQREMHQAVEALYHNLNTLQSRSGGQVPFSSINYGTCTLPEGRMTTKELLNVLIEGLGKLHKTSIFPCGIFQKMKGVNDKESPNYDLYRLALQSTAKRLYPNYANCDWSGNAGYDRNDPKTYFSTMGCRTANGWDINGFGQLKDGRGNICPVTIILPELAMLADRDVEKFMSLLDVKIHEAKDMLLERFEWICSQSPKSAPFMYENNTMAGYIPEEGIRSALKHGTIVIGQLGLAETLELLVGENHCHPEGMKLAHRIEALFRDRCKQFKEEYKLNFGVYYTPAENLCYTAMTKFKNKYGIIPKVSDKEYFTNSMHVPVWEKIGPFDKIDIEAQLTGYSSAGCITYVELDSGVVHNIDALEQLVDYAMDKDIPYFAVNVPNDTCLECGFTGEFNNECPMCHSKNIQQLRRVTGYLTGNYKTAFNYGKQKETEDRVKHGRGNI